MEKEEFCNTCGAEVSDKDKRKLKLLERVSKFIEEDIDELCLDEWITKHKVDYICAVRIDLADKLATVVDAMYKEAQSDH